MTLTSIGGLTPSQQNADAKVQGTPEQHKVARDFEAIFMRKLLSSMEKTGGMAGAGGGSGAGVYRSMMVGALADSAAEGGGIGLADLILQAMLRSQGEPPPAAAPGGVSHDGTAGVSGEPELVTPAEPLRAQPAPVDSTPDTEKVEASRGAPKGGGK